MEPQRREDAKVTVIDAEVERLAAEIVDAAFQVHSYFGPGLLESVYEKALYLELKKRNIQCDIQKEIPVYYGDESLGLGFRADLVVEDKIIVELKSVEKLLPIHKAQIISYLRLTNKPLGFLINFNNNLIKNGIVRVINDRFVT